MLKSQLAHNVLLLDVVGDLKADYFLLNEDMKKNADFTKFPNLGKRLLVAGNLFVIQL